MSAKDPLHRIAEQVADCFADSGYAFVEQDKIDGLAVMLNSFLTVAGIPTNPPKGALIPSTSRTDDTELPSTLSP